jgi:hypothetical protein
MKEIFEFAFSTPNLIPTCLLLFVALYWLVVLFGLLDIGHVDLHVDHDMHADVHADIHADVHADIDADAHGGEIHSDGPGGFMQSLIFFNVGKVPLLVLLSFFAVPLWFLTIIVNYYLKVESFGTSILLLFPEMIVCLFIAKFTSAPIAHLFEKIEESTGKATDFTGKTAIARFDMEENREGHIEIDENGRNIVLHARCDKGRLAKGDRVLIIDYNKEDNYYLVEPF